MQIKEFENLPPNKEKKVIKSVKRTVRTRWLSLEVAVDGVFKEYSHLVYALGELQQDPNKKHCQRFTQKDGQHQAFINGIHIFKIK